MRTITNKKLGAYHLFAAAFLPIAGSGQVVVTDYDPDIMVYDGPFPAPDEVFLDVDGNGADDFRIEAVYYDWTTFAGEFGYFSIEPLGENGVLFYTGTFTQYCFGAGTNVVDINMAQELELGAFIGVGLATIEAPVFINNWQIDSGGACSTVFNLGGFSSGDTYVGFVLKNGAAENYGWMRIKTVTYGFENMTILSSAINLTEGAPILAGLAEDCFAPIPLPTAAITATTAKIKWSPMVDVDHFELQYRPVGAADWTTKIVSGVKSFRKVAGLACSTPYEWQIRSICVGGDVSEYADIQAFTTESCRISDETELENEYIEIYTAAGEIFINITKDICSPLQVEVFDMLGRVCFSTVISDNQNIIQPDLMAGVYVVKVGSVMVEVVIL